jgi:D-serine deaminase-like pyridoxal phosphate-dependent protein
MDWPHIPDDHPTPSLVVHAPRVRRNIDRMQAYCREHALRLRPHTKTHKSLHMARWQLGAGAAGLTVAKVGEAERMSEVCQDIFIAYPAVGRHRLERLGRLAQRCRLSVGVDSLAAAQSIQEAASRFDTTVGLVVDLDVGFARTGIAASSDAMALCEWVSRQKNLHFEGVMCFPGHILPNAEESVWRAYSSSIQTVLDGLEQRGISVSVVSGGSTPTAMQSHRNRFLNEIRPGTYIYNDWNEVRLGVATEDDCAARILATVVSTSSRSKFVVDAGSKTLSSDRNAVDADSGFGRVVGYPDAKIARLSEEHGEITLPETSPLAAPPVGERVWIIPNHICVCVNLQNTFYLVDANETLELPVDARGMLV